MQKCQNIVSIEYKGEKHKKGSAFILPVLNNECMFLITAHHIFDYSSTIDANLISVVGLDKSELSFDYDSEYIINKELDLCILKLKYRDGFCCPIISSPHENEKVLMFGFPDVLSKATRIYHALNCTIEELRDDRVFAKIVDDISNYMNDDHKMIEGFSGCPFISYMETDSICFLGIENKTETDDASYKLVEGITGIFISHYIYNSFYKDKDIDIAELFFIQNPNDHYIATSEENYVVAFRNSVKRSKNNIMRIDDVLGNGFVLERSEIIDKITSSNSQFITIYGEAGSGKSALAKRVVKEQRYVLFARAEQFVREESLNNIWNFDLYELLKHVTNISVYIVIDAFEFIADKSKRYNLLFQLYDLTSQNRNVTIIATCRESDKSAFLQLESNYNVQCFEVEPISAHELDDISSTFETIRQMRKNGQYSQLLKFPFYINIIIRNNINIDDINDQNSFRELIYSRIICLNEKLDKYNLSSEDIVSVINEITFRRAKEFLLGINKDELKSNVLKALISEGVVIEKEGYIRLRYDIFEDIVFEHEFDKEFVKCRGIYNVFYETITGFGRCVYRRYQIWIANKLFIKDSREKFIYHLLFADDSDEEWNKQTIIGIVKSDYCVEFFNEYNADLVANGILQRFIDIINLYAFFPRVSESKKMQLTPIGKARGEIICIINDNKIELTNSVNEYSIIKLCNDYSLSSYQNSQYSFAACCIIESIIDNKKVDEKYYYSAETRICPLLSILDLLGN